MTGADLENERIWQRKVVSNQAETLAALRRIEDLLQAILKASPIGRPGADAKEPRPE